MSSILSFPILTFFFRCSLVFCSTWIFGVESLSQSRFSDGPKSERMTGNKMTPWNRPNDTVSMNTLKNVRRT